MADYPVRNGAGQTVIVGGPANPLARVGDIPAVVAEAAPAVVQSTVMGMLATSSDLPKPEATAATAGAEAKIARPDHAHGRLSSVRMATTGVNGEATLTFTRSFVDPPGMVCMAIEAGDTYAPTFKVKKWMNDLGADWVQGAGRPIKGALMRCDRNRPLPSVLTLLTALINYETRVAAANVSFTYIAIEQSTVS